MKRLKQFLITVLIILVVLELALRLFGYLPHEMIVIPRNKDQEKAFGLLDSQGVYLKPSRTQRKINGRTFNYSHTNYGTRTTFKSDSSDMPAIAMFGCSFTYGTSLDDKETYPYIADSLITDYNVINYGIPGTGQVHDLIKIERVLKNDSRKNVKIIIVNYLSFHNERNCSGSDYAIKNLNDIYLGYKETWKEAYTYMSNISLPFAKYENDNYQIVYKTYNELINAEFPLIRQSALMNRLNNAYYNYSIRKNEIKITTYLLGQIKKLCDQYQVKLFISYMESNEKTKDVVEYCKDRKIDMLYLPVNLNDKSNYNAPIDPSHLNPKANLFIALKLSEFINHKIISVNSLN